VLKQLSLSENPVASTPLKEQVSFLLRNLYSAASVFCYGNSDCDPCKEIGVGSLSDRSCERPVSSSVPLVTLLAHGCHFVAQFDRITDFLTLILYLENYAFLCLHVARSDFFLERTFYTHSVTGTVRMQTLLQGIRLHLQ